MTMAKPDEQQRRMRLTALEAAKHHINQGYTTREAKLAAAEELLVYGVFTTVQITSWLGLSAYTLEGRATAKGWGIGQLEKEQLDVAIALAKEGLAGTKPKTLIYQAYRDSGLTFPMIAGLLGLHKNTIRRIVRRIEGEPWT